jgi:hypothetical protein
MQQPSGRCPGLPVASFRLLAGDKRRGPRNRRMVAMAFVHDACGGPAIRASDGELAGCAGHAALRSVGGGRRQAATEQAVPGRAGSFLFRAEVPYCIAPARVLPCQKSMEGGGGIWDWGCAPNSVLFRSLRLVMAGNLLPVRRSSEREACSSRTVAPRSTYTVVGACACRLHRSGYDRSEKDQRRSSGSVHDAIHQPSSGMPCVRVRSLRSVSAGSVDIPTGRGNRWQPERIASASGDFGWRGRVNSCTSGPERFTLGPRQAPVAIAGTATPPGYGLLISYNAASGARIKRP